MSFFNASVTFEIITELDFYFETTALMNSSTKPFDDDIADISYRHRTIVAVIWFVVAGIGLFGNALVVASVIVAKKLQTTTNILVVNLAIADFLTCLCLPIQSLMLLGQPGFFHIPDTLCTVVGGTTYTLILCSISTLVAIAFVRWYVITKSVRGHRGLYTRRKIKVVVVIIWGESLLITYAPSLMGIVEFGHSQYYSLCGITDSNPLRGYYTLLQGLILVIALITIGVFYSLIWAYVVRNHRDLRARLPSRNSKINQSDFCNVTTTTTSISAVSAPRYSTTNGEFRQLSAREIIHRREVAITKNLFAVVCIFALCYLPTGINLLVPGANVFTLYSMMIGLANNSVNPLIYGLKHPIFQEVFKKILFCNFSELLD